MTMTDELFAAAVRWWWDSRSGRQQAARYELYRRASRGTARDADRLARRVTAWLRGRGERVKG